MRDNKKTIVEFLLLVGIVIMLIRHIQKKYERMIKVANRECEKQARLFHVTDEWLKAKIHGHQVAEYLKRSGYTNVAIYGMAHMGQSLIDELEETSISIKYGIDRDAEVYWNKFPIVKPDEISEHDFEDVDVIIVTPITYYAEIREQLSTKVSCRIISLEEII